MAIPWLLALKVIPWRDVIEHAPAVLDGARRLLEQARNKKAAPVPPPAPDVQLPSDPVGQLAVLHRELALARTRSDELLDTQRQLTQTVADLAEQNARLVAAVALLRLRTRVMLFVGMGMLAWLAWLTWAA